MSPAQQLVSRLLENDPDEVPPKDYLEKVDFTKRARSFRIISHGLVWSDYFQGHSVLFTDWEDCGVGWGDDAYLALDDALTQLAENGWDLSQIEAEIEAEKNSWDRKRVEDTSVDTWVDENISDMDRDHGNFETPQQVVSVDVSQEGEGYDPLSAQPT